jgi:hypothetical protein
MKKVSIEEMVDLLEEIGESRNTETEEYLLALSRVWNAVSYGGSKSFIKSLKQEIKDQYNWVIDNYTKIDREKINKYTEWVFNEELSKD